ncbi:phosphatidylserine/phosphatidylglycerophosphate/cardiolipin synthase family protein [bacterium]|nr:phosphatidylserine/phosphatidylglycerophosphate/cardiolipin synthase family protein [candidate division CSSED10-310 bacterium]
MIRGQAGRGWLLLVVLAAATVRAAEMDAFLAPRGGFAADNRERTITMPDGSEQPGTMENAVLELIQRAGAGSTIHLAMYSFSARHIQDALIQAARRGATVLLILDGVNEFAEKPRRELLDKIAAAGVNIPVKVVTAERMKELGRTLAHTGGRVFTGSMHEKFGVFEYGDGAPAAVFAGSANLSYSSDSMFAENRIRVIGDDRLAMTLEDEFAILWEHYGTCAVETCPELPRPSARTPDDDGTLTFITNSTPDDGGTVMTGQVIRLLGKAGIKGGSVAAAMFYFTGKPIADALLRLAAEHPGSTLRILLDQGQLDREEDEEVLGQWLEEEAERLRLRNLEIRYRWEPDAYGWDEERTPPGPAKVFALAPFLMHHKFFIVNDSILVNGSFNWTALGDRNLENLLVVNGSEPRARRLVDRFAAEFEELWRHQSIGGPAGRAVKRMIYEKLMEEHSRGEAATKP